MEKYKSINIEILNLFDWEIILSATVVFILGFLILRPLLGSLAAYIVSFIKSFIPLIYFSFFLIDDWHIGDTFKFYSYGVQVANIIETPGLNLFEYLYLVGSNVSHTVAGLFFYISFILFGYNLYAPIMLSVVLSFLTVRVLNNLLRISVSSELNISFKYILLFYAIHPYVLGWTSFVALREVISSFFVILFYYYFNLILVKRDFRLTNFLVIFLLIFIFIDLRYYLVIFLFAPLLFIGTCSLGLFRVSKHPLYLLAIGFPFFLYFVPLDFSFLSEHYSFLKNFISFYISPIPWKLDFSYLYLFPASVLNILFIVPSFFFIGQLVKSFPALIFPLSSVLVASIIYALVGMGIRHRYQFEFIFILLQFYSMRYILIGHFYRDLMKIRAFYMS